MMNRTFDGEDFVAARDEARLSTQHQRVRHAALNWDGGWFTMPEMAAKTGDPAGSVERQVRYLRAARFGGYDVEKRHRSGGTFEYRVMVPKDLP